MKNAHYRFENCSDTKYPILQKEYIKSNKKNFECDAIYKLISLKKDMWASAVAIFKHTKEGLWLTG